jgi:hypothetical protein
LFCSLINRLCQNDPVSLSEQKGSTLMTRKCRSFSLLGFQIEAHTEPSFWDGANYSLNPLSSSKELTSKGFTARIQLFLGFVQSEIESKTKKDVVASLAKCIKKITSSYPGDHFSSHVAKN